jgi:hypothetical protein
MSVLLLAIAALQSFVLVADPDPKGGPPLPIQLPHSSIAAVLARRAELGLTPAQVRDLERRDEALQREQGDIRERFSVPAGDPSAKSPLSFKGPGSGGGQGNPGGGTGGAPGGRGGHGKGTQGQKPKSDGPGDRATRLAEELDTADTRAWLEAAAKLPPQLQDKATAVAEKYREELAEQRESSGK